MSATWPWWWYLLIAIGIFIVLLIISYIVRVLQVKRARGDNVDPLPVTIDNKTNEIAPKKRLRLVIPDRGRRDTRNSLIPGIALLNQKWRNTKSDDQEAIVSQSLLGSIYKQETIKNKYVSPNLMPRFNKKLNKTTQTQRESPKNFKKDMKSCCSTSKAKNVYRDPSLISLKKTDSSISRTGSYMIRSILPSNKNRENKIERQIFKDNSAISLKSVGFMKEDSEFSGIDISLSKIYDIKIGSDHIEVIGLSDIKNKTSFATSAYENLCCKIYGDPLFLSHIKEKLLNNQFTIKGLQKAIDLGPVSTYCYIEENKASSSKENRIRNEPVKLTSDCEQVSPVSFADGFLPGVDNKNWKRGVAIKLPSGKILNTLDKEQQIEWTLNASKSDKIQKSNPVSSQFQDVRRYSL